MKQIIALTICLFISGASFAQKKAKTDNSPAAAQRKLVASGRCAIKGYFHDTHKHPIIGVKAFIYQKDSSILASGYTDSTGHYETNSVLPGVYVVKMVYPTDKTLTITGVTLKKGYTDLSIKADPPTTDSTQPYTDFVPKTEKSKPGKGGTTKTTTTTTKVTTTTTTTTTPPKKK